MRSLLFTLIVGWCGAIALGNEIKFAVANKPWEEGLGSCRAVVHVEQPAHAVRVQIPWRRHDVDPQNKAIVIVDATTNKRVGNFSRVEVNRESGTLLFAPPTAPGDYFVYYLPYQPQPGWGNYTLDYITKDDSDPDWSEKLATNSPLAEAQVKEIEYRTEFDRFDPMEIIATGEEAGHLLSQFPEREYFLFPEDRRFPIRMTNDLPLRWIENGPTNAFAGKAMRNEFYCFQIGVWAPKKSLENLSVAFSPLQQASSGATIPAQSLRCFNLAGVAPDGKPFAIPLSVPQHKIQALWIGIDISSDAPPGEYHGAVTVRPKNAAASTIALTLTISPDILQDRGDSEPWRHSRLRWLDSTLGIDDTVVPPYTPLSTHQRTVSCLGRDLVFDDQGLPEQILVGDRSILAAPISFSVDAGHGASDLGKAEVQFTKTSAASVSWEASSKTDQLAYACQATMEFDGHVDYHLTLQANRALWVRNIHLDIPMRDDVGRYFMGAGKKGGLFTNRGYDWKWNTPHDSFWLGDASAGLHCELRGATYCGPLLNLYHPAPPDSWSNHGNGGVRIDRETKGALTARIYTGPRDLKTGQELHFDFALLITPVKPLDTVAHFNERYFHSGGPPLPPTDPMAAGINVINIHHANPVNPFINYPFIATKTMKDFVDQWHAKGTKVKIYYTIRELSNHVTEMAALRSLGNEILADGPGGGFPWLREHLIDHYAPSWYTVVVDGKTQLGVDASIVTAPGSTRWQNYYIEGLNWLLQNENIDGLYLDDVAYDRTILKRMRRVMEANKKGCLIDLHSNTFFSLGPANQYAEFFPYIDRLWFGEGFRYNEEGPDYWLTEISGIPFGLMGDMLQDGGNKYRGMLYGMTARLPNDANADPRPIWKLWDEFKIADAKMIGYWEQYSPVRTDNPDVPATVFVRNGQALIALASWAQTPVNVKLQIDYRSLGLDPRTISITAPAVEGFQPQGIYGPKDSIHIDPLKGCLLLLK